MLLSTAMAAQQIESNPIGTVSAPVDDVIGKSLKIESPETPTFLDSKPFQIIERLGTLLYFWVDRNIVEKGGYDINSNNGWLIDSICQGAFRVRKAIPSAKELQDAHLLNPLSLTKMALSYGRSFANRHCIQPFHDSEGVEYWSLNLNLQETNIDESAKTIAASPKHISVVLGDCSKGHLLSEAPGIDEVHVCPYRVDERCYYKENQSFLPRVGSPFYACAQSPCLVGYLHKTIGAGSAAKNDYSLHTILGGVQTFREVPNFFYMNTEKGQAQYIIWATCKFSIPYLVQAARMFPNIQGLAIAYENGCRTLCDRIIRLRGERRDKHITRFSSAPTGVELNPISTLLSKIEDAR